MIAPLSLLGMALVLNSLVISGVQGHGFVQTVNIGGTSYPGWDPDTDPYAKL